MWNTALWNTACGILYAICTFVGSQLQPALRLYQFIYWWKWLVVQRTIIKMVQMVSNDIKMVQLVSKNIKMVQMVSKMAQMVSNNNIKMAQMILKRYKWYEIISKWHK